MKKLAWIILLMIWVLLAVVGHAEAKELNFGALLHAEEVGSDFGALLHAEEVGSDFGALLHAEEVGADFGALVHVEEVGSDSEALLQTVKNAEEIAESELYARAAVLMDADSGRVLYGKNEDQVLAMASTTKIMTCILALENADLSESVTISAYASGMPAVKLGARKGENYQLRDLLYSLMLESHNDVAVAIAEHIGKCHLSEELQNKSTAEYSEEESRQAVAAFAALMNEKAEELGCTNTWFITPNGLDADESVQQENGEILERFHSTTAEELASIMSYCVLRSPKAEQFLEITQTPSHTFTGENGRSFACYNHNAFLSMMSGAISGKTGFTNRAGYCYVGALEDDGRTFVVALLACGWPYNKNYKWSDTRKLMEYGIEYYIYRSFLDEETVFDKKWLKPILVTDGQTEILGETAYVPVEVRVQDAEQGDEDPGYGEGQSEEEKVRQQKDGQNVIIQKYGGQGNLDGLLMRAGEEIAVEYSQKEILTAPVEEGTAVGSVRYMVEGITYRTEEIVTAGSVERIDWQWCLEQIFGRYLLYD